MKWHWPEYNHLLKSGFSFLFSILWNGIVKISSSGFSLRQCTHIQSVLQQPSVFLPYQLNFSLCTYLLVSMSNFNLSFFHIKSAYRLLFDSDMRYTRIVLCYDYYCYCICIAVCVFVHLFICIFKYIVVLFRISWRGEPLDRTLFILGNPLRSSCFFFLPRYYYSLLYLLLFLPKKMCIIVLFIYRRSKVNKNRNIKNIV